MNESYERKITSLQNENRTIISKSERINKKYYELEDQHRRLIRSYQELKRKLEHKDLIYQQLKEKYGLNDTVNLKGANTKTGVYYEVFRK
jgi:predicted nuclease with TOPRIM domain